MPAAFLQHFFEVYGDIQRSKCLSLQIWRCPFSMNRNGDQHDQQIEIGQCRHFLTVQEHVLLCRSIPEKTEGQTWPLSFQTGPLLSEVRALCWQTVQSVWRLVNLRSFHQWIFFTTVMCRKRQLACLGFSGKTTRSCWREISHQL